MGCLKGNYEVDTQDLSKEESGQARGSWAICMPAGEGF